MELKGYALAMFKSELESIVGDENVNILEKSIQENAIDQFWITHMWKQKNEEIPTPYFIVSPATTEETSRIVKTCNRYKMPVVTRGGGSGTAGGAATMYGGIVLDVKRMNKIIDIDNESLILTAQPGINGRTLEDELNKKSLMLAHYPSSVDISTLGGYIAARGSGVMSTKYGKAEDMVISLEIVLPDGQIINTLSTPNHAAGPGLLDVFIGSEGTLGIITEIKIRLDPIPEKRLFRMVEFPTIYDGLEAGRQIMMNRLNPTVIRLYDEGSTRKSLNPTGLDLNGNFMVLMFDGHENIAREQEKESIDICLANKGIDKGEELGKHWWETRYVAYKPPVHPAYPLMYGTPETVTTYKNIAKIYDEKKELIENKYKKWNAEYTAHFSHWYPWGTMIYDRFYIENTPEDAYETLRLHNQIWEDCTQINLKNSGVLNEHHGIGIKLGWLMPEQYGETFDVLTKFKKILDPKGIMNPGKLGFEIY